MIMRSAFTLLIMIMLLMSSASVLLPSESGGGDPKSLSSARIDPNDPHDGDLDPDGDGLTNKEEYQHGTAPNNPDTDGDGLPDGWEVKYGLNPLSSKGDNGTAGNPDGDGWTNIQEYNYVTPDGLYQGTDPKNPNTDGDEYTDDATDPFPLDPYNGKSTTAVFFYANSTGPNRYWRAISYSDYNGQGTTTWWEAGNETAIPYNGSELPGAYPYPNTTQTYSIEYVTVNGSTYATTSLYFAPNTSVFVPSALNTRRVWGLSPYRDLNVSSPGGYFLYNRTLSPPNYLSSYYVNVTQYTIPLATLRAASSANSTEYLQYPAYYLPNSTYYKVANLTKNLTQAKTNAYDKAKAISDHLYNNYAYRSNPARAPLGTDKVYWFLFGQNESGKFNPNITGYDNKRFGEGTSQDFATAFVIMCRIANVSARFAVGYRSEEENSASNGYTVRGTCLKAWGEVVLEGVPVQEFDPTPPAPQSGSEQGPDKTKDDDKDGILDYIERGDGNPNTMPADFDNDGALDAVDLDDDNDAILDILDAQSKDHDNDGVGDAQDEDGDNDGLADQRYALMDLDLDGVQNPFDADRDGNAVADVNDTGQGGTVAWGSGGYDPVHWRNTTNDLDADGYNNSVDPDMDGDGKVNRLDDDDDNDGANDPDDVDDDNDGVLDALDADTDNDLDNDGIKSELDSDIDGDWVNNDLDQDIDNDGIPNFWDGDRDNDGKADVNETHYGGSVAWGTSSVDRKYWRNTTDDLDGDGVLNEVDQHLNDGLGMLSDWDHDGVANIYDVDDDNDGALDAIDLDTDDDLDNDGVKNGAEADMDDDGTDDPDDPDDDNDGIPDAYDADYDNDGAANAADPALDQDLSPLDHDNDGTLDIKDNDRDGDGRLDANLDGIENIGSSDHDHDDDGIPDDEDPDDDEDGMTDSDEISLYPQIFELPPINPWDHDNDGVPDDTDPDDDNDARTDIDTDADHVEDAYTTMDWDWDNDGVLDRDDKVPTRVNITAPELGYLSERINVTGHVAFLNGTPGRRLVVSVHLNRTVYNATNQSKLDSSASVYESASVQADENGNFSLAVYPRMPDVEVGPKTKYALVAQVHDLLLFRGNWSAHSAIGLRSRTVVDLQVTGSVISDEEPLEATATVKYLGTDEPVPFAGLNIEWDNTTFPGFKADAAGSIDVYYNSSAGMFKYRTGPMPNISYPVGAYSLNLTYKPSVGNASTWYGAYLDPSYEVRQVSVLHRANFTAFIRTPSGAVRNFSEAVNLSVIVGESLTFFGQVRETGAGRFGNLTLYLDSEVLLEIDPDGAGMFIKNVTFTPTQYRAGFRSLRLTFSEPDYYIPQDTLYQELLIIGTSSFVYLTTGTAYRGQEAHIEGKLVSNLAEGIPYSDVSMRWGSFHFLGKTNGQGWLSIDYDVMEIFPLGPVSVQFNYSGSEIYLPSGSNTTYTVVSATAFFVGSYTNETRRGSAEHAFSVGGILTDDNSTADDDVGRRLAGYQVELLEDRTVVAVATTDALGGFNLSYVIPTTYPVGNATLYLRFNGSGFYLPTFSEELHFAVVSQTKLTVGTLDILLDKMNPDFTPAPKQFRVTGRLLDDQDQAVFQADIAIDIPKLNLHAQARTDSSGRYSYEFTLQPAGQVLGTYDVNVTYSGLAYHYLPENKSTDMKLRVNSLLNATKLEKIVRGVPTHLAGHLYQSNGVALAGREVAIGIGYTTLAIVSANSEGRFDYVINLSADFRLGKALVWIDYQGTKYISPLNESQELYVKARTSIEVVSHPQSLRTGTPMEVTARLLMDNGTPIEQSNVWLYNDYDPPFANVTDTEGLVLFALLYKGTSIKNETLTFNYDGANIYEPSEASVDVGWVPEPSKPVRSYFLEAVALILIVLALLAVGAYLFVRRLQRKKELRLPPLPVVPDQLIVPKNEYVKEIFRLYRAYAGGLLEHGYVPQRAQTVWEEAEGARAMGLPLPMKSVKGLLGKFEMARYSDAAINEGTVNAARQDYQAVESALKGPMAARPAKKEGGGK